ncbi:MULTISPECIES: ABC transporter permease [Streptomyces]|uniref:Transport permease protein n=1 Tax=Streptomyces venezuelae (strain ATCC 10712 / CBS 650.69 / DSM 40230 / JCM 4526 / NBRC 13096 / PD 04745) TaxID=953739 RepID=F2R3U7_STRVP|nr:ABC transporter permease [Streptomyces venezuelae]APE23941.1 multidrug ABC transporter permease [Streptomyces venezuelae]QES01309.1 ABC transporter permease [Streptomyces venezuelae ATCC 10712]QES08394.1 ABC transporter permease [Streptomyces venezuelae]QES12918.1 ABC transporter permease [Streptomyces venezuelae]CCA58319.1 putative ABC transporter transmembrane protein [Streptomyces venezuelae ATCC 10712]
MLIHDTALLFGRYTRQTLRSPFQIFFGTLMPLLYLLFFGPLLTGLPLGREGDSWQILVPGLLLQLGLFGASFAGFSIIMEKNWGVFDRMRVTPVSRLALLLGRVLRDAALFVFQAVLLVLVALPMGLRAPLAGILIGFGFVALLSVALASLSYALALKLRTPQEFGPAINTLAMPAMLLSGLMLPMALAPGWLDVLSHLMPFRYLVDAVREAYIGHYTTPTLLYGVLVALAVAALAVTVGTRTFRRTVA